MLHCQYVTIWNLQPAEEESVLFSKSNVIYSKLHDNMGEESPLLSKSRWRLRTSGEGEHQQNTKHSGLLKTAVRIESVDFGCVQSQGSPNYSVWFQQNVYMRYQNPSTHWNQHYFSAHTLVSEWKILIVTRWKMQLMLQLQNVPILRKCLHKPTHKWVYRHIDS